MEQLPDDLKPEFDPRFLKTIIFGTPIRLFCQDCGKYVPSTMPWVCPYCDAKHAEVRLHTFLYGCKSCKRRPDGLVCPHCGTTWSFIENSAVKHPARRVPGAPLPIEPESNRKRREHEERKENLRFQIDEKKLEAELNEIESRKNLSSKKNPRDRLEAEFMEEQTRFMGVKEIVAKWKKIYEEMYRNDPEMLKDALEFLEDWRRRHL